MVTSREGEGENNEKNSDDDARSRCQVQHALGKGRFE